MAAGSKAAKRRHTPVTKRSGGRQKARPVPRRISDSSFNVAALSSSMVSTPKVGSKRWKALTVAVARQSGGSGGRRVSKQGVKRKKSTTVSSGASTPSAEPSSPPPRKKARLPAGNSLQKSATDIGTLFRNDHMSWNVSGLSSLPSVEDLLEQPPDNPPPPSVDKTVIEIEDSDNELEEGEIGATLVEVGQDLLDLVTPGEGGKQLPPPTPRTIIRGGMLATVHPPQVNNETIVLDDTADANESRTSSPCSIIEILSPADDVVEVHRCVAPPSNIQSIAAKYYTPPSMDFIPLSSNRGGGQIRPTWAQVAQAQGSRRARPAHAPRESERLQRGRARARGRPTGGQSDACATRFSAASGRRPDLQFGGVIGPPPRGDNVFRFTGRGGSNAVAEPTATMYSVGSTAPQSGLRPIVIDGSNVAMSHGRSHTFSVRGIQLVIDFFRERGHQKIVAFLPEFRKKASMSSDPKLLDKMEKEGHVVCTPSRETDTARIASYDDKFILDYAAKNGGVVITRDNYRDLIREKVEWREVIEKRLLMPTFPDADSVMFPDDPLGRHGPGLNEFLLF